MFCVGTVIVLIALLKSRSDAYWRSKLGQDTPCKYLALQGKPIHQIYIQVVSAHLGSKERRCKLTPKKDGKYLPATLTKMSLPSCILSTRMASSLQSCNSHQYSHTVYLVYMSEYMSSCMSIHISLHMSWYMS